MSVDSVHPCAIDGALHEGKYPGSRPQTTQHAGKSNSRRWSCDFVQVRVQELARAREEGDNLLDDRLMKTNQTERDVNHRNHHEYCRKQSHYTE